VELLLISLLVFFLPSQLGLHFWPAFSYVSGIRVDYLSPTLLFTDLIILPLVILYLYRVFKTYSFAHISKKYLFLLLLILINIIFSNNPYISVYKYFRIFEYYLLARYLLSRYKYYYAGLKVIFPYSLILTNVLAWLQFFYQHSLGGFWYLWGERSVSVATPGIAKITIGSLGVFLRPYSTFSHPNSLAGFLLISGLILVYLYRQKSSPVILTSIIFCLITLPLTFSRTAIILEFTIFPLIFLGRRSLFVIVPLLLLLLTFTGNPSSLLERFRLFSLAQKQILLHPITGLGFGTFPTISPDFQPVHLVPVLLLSELGFPLFVTLSYLLLPIVKKIYFQNRYINYLWLGIFTISLVDHYWVTLTQNMLLLVLVLVLTLHTSLRTV
jgi:hypothetical protein